MENLIHVYKYVLCLQLTDLLLAKMANYVLLVDQVRMKVEWRFAMKINGEQCVTMAGAQTMLGWYADNLVFNHLVS